MFAGNKKGSHSHELELAAFHWHFAAVPINNVDTQVERVGVETELHVDFDQPVDKDGAHFGVDVILTVHVGLRLCSCLRSLERDEGVE